MKVALALVHFKVDLDSWEGDQGGDDTDTESTELAPEGDPLPEPAPARSHSKSRSKRTTSHHAEPSTSRDEVVKNTIISERGFSDDPF